MAMAAAGPPTETVGLEPYDPRLLPLEPIGGST
jgi:nitrate reductase molybdenum cofactor assembly chaperone NarJ/NarW